MEAFLTILRDEIAGSFVGVGWQRSLIRLVVATLFGVLIGFEREARGKSAGMRTHTIVSLAACVFALVALGFVDSPSSGGDAVRMDPLRLIEAITSGVAFLGAGTIIVARARVRGLTTAAGMWLSGAVGLAVGVGNIGLAAVATALAIFILGPLRRVEDDGAED